MKIKKQWFLEEDAGGSSGGGVSLTQMPVTHEGGESSEESTTTESEEDSTTSTESNTAPGLVNASELAREFAGALGKLPQFSVPAQHAPEPAKPLTPEERAQLMKDLGYPEIDDQFLTNFDDLDTRKATFTTFRDGVIKAAVSIARQMIEHERGQFDQRLQPLQSMIQEREQTERFSRFTTKYEQLKNPALRDLIVTVSERLNKADAFKGKDESAAFDLIAKNVEQVIAAGSPGFKLTPASAGQTKPSAGRRSGGIATTTNGSGGGGGNGGDSGEGQKGATRLGMLFPKPVPR